jgi:hypothetical protein
MSKNTSRILSLCLTLVLTISLMTGCSLFNEKVTKESLIEGSIKTLSKAESVDSNLEIDIGMAMEQNGFKIPVDMKIDAEIMAHKASETSYLSMQCVAEVFGNEMELSKEIYVVKDGDKLISYSYAGENGESTGWIKEEVEDSESSPIQTNAIFEYVKDAIQDFTLDEDMVEYKGVKCYLISGTAKGLSNIFDEYNFEDLMGDFDYENIDAKLNIYFREDTKEIYAIEVDMTEGFNKISGKDEAEAKIDNFIVSIRFNAFNKLDKIEVPESVKEKAQEMIEATVPEFTAPVLGDETEPENIDETKPVEDKP